MQKNIDKLLLLTCSSSLYYLTIDEFDVLIPFGIIIFLSALNQLTNKKLIHLGSFLIFTALCCVFPYYALFLPVTAYDIQTSFFRGASILAIIPFIINWSSYNSIFLLFTCLFFSISLLLSYKTQTIELLQEDYEAFRTTSRALTIAQETKSKSLLENQDYEIETAILNERNRISKEIHDHVGHVLSRSLLQIGALLTIAKEPEIKEGLTLLKESISEGMDSIRASIHNIHNESINLHTNLETLVREFTFCEAILNYSIKTVPMLKLKYCFIALTKEGLSNVAKHSNATKVVITLSEDETYYYFSFCDNGTISETAKLSILKCQARSEYTDGMGLQSMYDRTKGVQGSFQIDMEHGFHIYVTIPKEDTNEVINN
ncbi:sensor histidine kinase [Velocimicrobium porci]|uniref:histidine kinase n=1 Tax=Velocimicrobium porci TaxID=2606634 RepID=A0A6L5Y1L0_9FIRM|nr:histidine kinase [Velocimicrobium porci]MSS64278.1 hypothetical protein [Velocimicrobium porci]